MKQEKTSPLPLSQIQLMQDRPDPDGRQIDGRGGVQPVERCGGVPSTNQVSPATRVWKHWHAVQADAPVFSSPTCHMRRWPFLSVFGHSNTELSLRALGHSFLQHKDHTVSAQRNL
jgi:hypothetical protein